MRTSETFSDTLLRIDQIYNNVRENTCNQNAEALASALNFIMLHVQNLRLVTPPVDTVPLRDQFAMAALTGMTREIFNRLGDGHRYTLKECATESYLIADAMMKARSFDPKQERLDEYFETLNPAQKEAISRQKAKLAGGTEPLADYLAHLTPWQRKQFKTRAGIDFLTDQERAASPYDDETNAPKKCPHCDYYQQPGQSGVLEFQLHIMRHTSPTAEEKPAKCFFCSLAPSEQVHDPKFGTHLFAVRHEFMERCATCREPEGRCQHKNQVPQFTGQHDFKPSGKCFLCPEPPSHDIHAEHEPARCRKTNPDAKGDAGLFRCRMDEGHEPPCDFGC